MFASRSVHSERPPRLLLNEMSSVQRGFYTFEPAVQHQPHPEAAGDAYPRIEGFLPYGGGMPSDENAPQSEMEERPEQPPSPYVETGSAELTLSRRNGSDRRVLLHGEWRLTQIENRQQMFDAGARRRSHPTMGSAAGRSSAPHLRFFCTGYYRHVCSPLATAPMRRSRGG